ncbi:MAG TPA: NAD(P)/FAD-dependent oxidoreductase, partial [Candidatus Methylomirabilis sp.]|nr:NAD(P)/FAD-dependent oxidoreductase [Candidatus Methylomirabilis sp.]
MIRKIPPHLSSPHTGYPLGGVPEGEAWSRGEELDIRNWDVVVVGAGPAGCVAATLFARKGLRVVIVDKSAAPPSKVCGEYLSPGCLPILERIGALRNIREVGARPLHGMLISTSGGQVLRARYPSSHYGLAIRRELLDPILLDVAIKSDAEFLPHFQVSDLVWDGGRAVGIRGRHRGQPRMLRARLVIGADGRNSVVARRLGTVIRHRWLDKLALVGYITGARRADDLGQIFLGRDRYCILNPISPDLTNVGLVINRREFTPRTDATRYLMQTVTTFADLGDRLALARPICPARCLGPLAYHALRLTAPGALLIGDAAGFLDPFTGEGIYAALRSAELAAESALPSLLGDFDSVPDLLAYGESWRHEFLAKW